MQRSLIEEQKTKINDLEEKKEELELQLKAVEVNFFRFFCFYSNYSCLIFHCLTYCLGTEQ